MRRFLAEEAGQDFIEYALLLAFVVLFSAGLLFHNSAAIHSIWTVTTNNLETANSVARGQ